MKISSNETMTIVMDPIKYKIESHEQVIKFSSLSVLVRASEQLDKKTMYRL